MPIFKQKTPEEIAAENLKGQIQKHRPHAKEEPGKTRKAILDAMNEHLPQITEDYKQSLKQMKAAGTESYADWPAAYGKIFQHAQQLGIMLGCRWGSKRLTPSVHDQPKQENIRIESNVTDFNGVGQIKFDVKDVPDIMRPDPTKPNQGVELENFKKNMAGVCASVINDKGLKLDGQHDVTAIIPNPNTGVMELQVGGQNGRKLNKLEAETFMSQNENDIALHMKDQYKEYLKADVHIPAPRI